MKKELKTAALAGYERMAAWADLLDDINVYPVADADTGRNLKISLAPIKEIFSDNGQITAKLLRAATGNSGNIAAAFLGDFLSAESATQLSSRIISGNQKAWDSIASPQPGTMLTIFKTLGEVFERQSATAAKLSTAKLTDTLAKAVQTTPNLLPELKAAGVVDSGALGMFLFFEGFFKTLYAKTPAYISIPETFAGKLRQQRPPRKISSDEVCISTLIKTAGEASGVSRKLEALGSSLVTVQDGDNLKIHLHTKDLDAVRLELETWGSLVDWSAEPIAADPPAGSALWRDAQTVHIVSDAAGSITRQDADRLDVTLMDSYVISGDQAYLETAVAPRTLYKSMRAGHRISTAQASVFERHQNYESICSRFDKAVYLCVGSAYTGIYQIASDWQANQAAPVNMTVLDSGAASGRLGLITRAVAEFAQQGNPLAAVVAYARAAIEKCLELVFLDQLKYLAAGGRISKPGGFFGDLFHVKPVISPRAEGVRKVGVVRNNARQLPFALDYFAGRLGTDEKAKILLQYTDNLERVSTEVQPAIQSVYPSADVILTPLSLTSGVHMGPGTWAMAVLPELDAQCSAFHTNEQL